MMEMPRTGSGQSRSGGLRQQAAIYKLEQHMPGYTGFVPKIQNVLSSTYANSSRIAMSCPPTPDIETVEYNWLLGRRSLRTAAPLAGTGFSGFLNEEDGVDLETSLTHQKDYVQGSRVNLMSYYEDQSRKLEKAKRENPKSVTQRKNPVRNISKVPFGDTFYYSGKHMFETTSKESQDYHQHMPPAKRFEASISSMQQRSAKEALSYQYKVAHAMVGKLRLNLLHKLTGEMVQAKVITGNKDMIKMFNFFAAQKEQGVGGHAAHVTIGYKEFLKIAQKLGVYMTEREACALFGRYDTGCDGSLTYFQFIDLFFDEGERVKVDE